MWGVGIVGKGVLKAPGRELDKGLLGGDVGGPNSLLEGLRGHEVVTGSKGALGVDEHCTG